MRAPEPRTWQINGSGARKGAGSVVSEWAVPVVLEIQVVRAPLLLLLALLFSY